MVGRIRYKNGYKPTGELPEMKNLVQKFDSTETKLGKAEIERRFRR